MKIIVNVHAIIKKKRMEKETGLQWRMWHERDVFPSGFLQQENSQKLKNINELIQETKMTRKKRKEKKKKKD